VRVPPTVRVITSGYTVQSTALCSCAREDLLYSHPCRRPEFGASYNHPFLPISPYRRHQFRLFPVRFGYRDRQFDRYISFVRWFVRMSYVRKFDRCSPWRFYECAGFCCDARREYLLRVRPVDLSLSALGWSYCAEGRVHSSWGIVEAFHGGLVSTCVCNW
jgi:hypothetical protein